MILYIYKMENNEVVDVIRASTEKACEEIAGNRGYMGSDDYGATYDPAFGFKGGLET